MKKKILILILIPLLTSCKVTYSDYSDLAMLQQTKIKQISKEECLDSYCKVKNIYTADDPQTIKQLATFIQNFQPTTRYPMPQEKTTLFINEQIALHQAETKDGFLISINDNPLGYPSNQDILGQIATSSYTKRQVKDDTIYTDEIPSMQMQSTSNPQKNQFSFLLSLSKSVNLDSSVDLMASLAYSLLPQAEENTIPRQLLIDEINQLGEFKFLDEWQCIKNGVLFTMEKDGDCTFEILDNIQMDSYLVPIWQNDEEILFRRYHGVEMNQQGYLFDNNQAFDIIYPPFKENQYRLNEQLGDTILLKKNQQLIEEIIITPSITPTYETLNDFKTHSIYMILCEQYRQAHPLLDGIEFRENEDYYNIILHQTSYQENQHQASFLFDRHSGECIDGNLLIEEEAIIHYDSSPQLYESKVYLSEEGKLKFNEISDDENGIGVQVNEISMD